MRQRREGADFGWAEGAEPGGDDTERMGGVVEEDLEAAEQGAAMWVLRSRGPDSWFRHG